MENITCFLQWLCNNLPDFTKCVKIYLILTHYWGKYCVKIVLVLLTSLRYCNRFGILKHLRWFVVKLPLSQFMHFLCTFGQKKCFFLVKKRISWARSALLHGILYIAYYTAFNYTQKRRICRKNSKYESDESFCGQFCARWKAANFCHPGLDETIPFIFHI